MQPEDSGEAIREPRDGGGRGDREDRVEDRDDIGDDEDESPENSDGQDPGDPGLDAVVCDLVGGSHLSHRRNVDVFTACVADGERSSNNSR